MKSYSEWLSMQYLSSARLKSHVWSWRLLIAYFSLLTYNFPRISDHIKNSLSFIRNILKESSRCLCMELRKLLNAEAWGEIYNSRSVEDIVCRSYFAGNFQINIFIAIFTKRVVDYKIPPPPLNKTLNFVLHFLTNNIFFTTWFSEAPSTLLEKLSLLAQLIACQEE